MDEEGHFNENFCWQLKVGWRQPDPEFYSAQRKIPTFVWPTTSNFTMVHKIIQWKWMLKVGPREDRTPFHKAPRRASLLAVLH